MRSNSDNNYISLQEATRFCGYSQEYLSLQARRGKLKALKFCRNWVTTKEWLEEYLAKTGAYNQNIRNKKAKTSVVKTKIIKYPSPAPENLPVETFFMSKGLGWQDLKSAIIAALVFILIMAGGIFGKENLIKGYSDFSPYVEKINQVGELFIEDVARGIARFSDDFYLATVSYRDAAEFASGVFNEYSQWLRSQILK